MRPAVLPLSVFWTPLGVFGLGRGFVVEMVDGGLGGSRRKGLSGTKTGAVALAGAGVFGGVLDRPMMSVISVME